MNALVTKQSSIRSALACSNKNSKTPAYLNVLYYGVWVGQSSGLTCNKKVRTFQGKLSRENFPGKNFPGENFPGKTFQEKLSREHFPGKTGNALT